MSRLIDADALYDEVSNHVTSVSVCMTVEQAHGETNFKMRCLEDIDNAPTIDAIPVEWLRKILANKPETVEMLGVDVILMLWQNEQDGTDNSDKDGTWEPLGHRMGPCKHPWSEDYKCSLCGYEAYTVFDPPPDRCPKCNARLRLEQEAR